MITTGGEKVWPDEVERVLSTHRDVAEVAVWKRPDPEWGERVVAWVVAGRRHCRRSEELKELVAATLAPWAAPKEIVFTTELPRTPSGKVMRRAELTGCRRDPAQARPAQAAAPSARSSRMERSSRPISRGLPESFADLLALRRRGRRRVGRTTPGGPGRRARP